MSDVIKATKKPVTISAIQWNGKNHGDICQFMGVDFVSDDISSRLEIETLEGVITASCGDYIIKGIKGEFYPCKPDIFLATYDIHDKPEAEFNTKQEG